MGSPGGLEGRLVIFTSQLAPALIFGVLLGKYSHHNMATVETLIGSAVAYILWALFGGQPMILMGLTGPIAIFVGVVFDWAEWAKTTIGT